MSSLSSMMLSLVVILSTLLIPGLTQTCPSRCLCFRTTVRCMFLQLEKIPKVPPATTILDLRFNKIKHIPPDAFKGLKHLNTLLLNNNHIHTLVNGAFVGLDGLRYLYLYKNNIERIHSQAFKGLENLEQLYIHFNNIKELKPDTFANLPNLERLFLHNNKLKELPRGVFQPLKNLRRLRLDSNALICDCRLLWLAEMLKDNRGHTQAAATCEFPTALQGRSIMSINKDDFNCKKPVFTSEPSDVDVSFGNTVYLSCKADGNPDPQIIWLHNNNEIPIDPDGRAEEDGVPHFNVLADGTLMIQNTKDSDQGVYECMAKNEAGEVKSQQATLRYFSDQAAPSFVERPVDSEGNEGGGVTLNCQARGHPRPQITWFKNGSSLGRNRRFTITPTGSLIMGLLQHTDRGTYTCEAKNEVATITASAKLKVRVWPVFVSRPEDKVVVEGEIVEFICQVEGYPQPSLRWTKDGRALTSNAHVQILADNTIVRIVAVTIEDRGNYECHAENNAGRRRSSATLLVRPRVAPSFTERPVDVQDEVGSNIELRCQADGDPTPSVTWAKNGRVLLPDEHVSFRSNGILTLINVTELASGRYECRAENNIGTASAVVTVTVRPSQIREYIGDRFVRPAIEQAGRNVDTAMNNTLRELFDRNRPRSPNDLLTIFRLPSRAAVHVSRAAEVYERTLELVHNHVVAGHKFDPTHSEPSYKHIISPSALVTIANLSGCLEFRREVNCTDMCFHHKYRTLDGTCNNLQHPMWGASLTGFKRLLPPIYENNFNTPVGWNTTKLYYGFPKPSARLVSTSVIAARKVEQDEKYTSVLMQWGQFMDHDIDLAPVALSNAQFSDGRHCNETCENQSPCFPIPIPANDPRIRRHRCMGVTRSSAMCGTGTTSLFFQRVMPREQINQITSYIDASNVYGSSEEETNELRDISSEKGLLRTGQGINNGKHMLPPALHRIVDCQIDPTRAATPCYLAGDHRANEQLGLLSMHTVWMREHNRIASRLLDLNPHWDGSMIFHESRKIVGAMMQHITFKQWLPNFIGPIGMEMLGPYKGYDPYVEATVANSFTTAALRVGHTLVNPIIYRFNASFQEIPEGHLPLHKAFFAPFRLQEEGGVDPVLRGLFHTPAKKLTSDGILNKELTEKLFKLAHEIALDLAALNIQRGRDHGLPGYNEYREFCNLTKAETFNDLQREIRDPELREKLKQVYGHPGNIDLWVGGVAENPVEGAKMGPTFLCILVEQFRRIRDGDRFWYENPGVFNAAQLTQIKQTSLARLFCDNGDSIHKIQKDVFLIANYPQDYVTCDKIPHVDLKLWTDCCTDCSSSGEFNSLISHYRRRRKRSTDHSYPEDKPTLEKYENLPDENYANRTNEEGVKQQEIDLIDSRIEGVEDIMQGLQKHVKSLTRKIRKLEKQLHARECRDHEGKQRKHRDRWRVNDCKHCECKHSHVECHHITCPIAECKTPKTIKGQCCPVC